MPVVPYIDPDRVPPAAEGGLPLVFAPFFALLGVLGLAVVGYELPAILLLFAEGGSTLTLLRTYWTGYAIFSVFAVLSPLPFLGLTFLLYWRTARRLDPASRRETRLSPLILLPFCLPLIGILMWSALAPSGTCARCDKIAADIQQIEAGQTEHITAFIHANSAPDTVFKDNPEGWRVFDRRAVGTDGRGLALRFPEALEAALDPAGLALDDWDGVQWYEIAYTSNFHLVTEITPVND